MSEAKERLDLLLVNKGLFTSRERARASIMAGEIFVDGIRVDKCGEKVKEAANIEFRGQTMPYVSRGGLKLEKAIKTFGVQLEGKTCMDIGASTGGFTDCMLQNGAVKVFSVDVGYGQLAWKLRTDERVVCIERTNVRYLTFEQIGQYCDFASIDVSFISLKTIMSAVVNLLNEDAKIVALIKPQFEAGREKVGKKGVVREKSTHIEVINKVIDFCHSINLVILGLSFSPITGPEGNIEYLLYLTKDASVKEDFDMSLVENTVEESHKSLS
ncbi:TlyA family RNA methyltransferase [Clostridium omnivorum]|uniref:TlyA family rRNA (Cytidine-2'-O)-methyltransferase n=1 Tax=Clostridium omnivorum TaxID=1604902 RepID=A0ABQ5NB54_9CLOT|nr:TlyA family RNA methyltransferase [Clostridium sp. E14]GLC32438.1 TlyA family rRNA (cytidine-2'-O)-methyltransferase [Clostridium sp. E14]